MVQVRRRLNFGQSTRGVITFDGTFEIISELEGMDHDLVRTTMTEELEKDLEAAERLFKLRGHTIAKDSS